MQSTSSSSADANAELRALYRSLLENDQRFHEFKQLLALYPAASSASAEEAEAATIREQLNRRIREWVGGNFEGLSAMQLLLWRSIVVEERFNVALSPWKESNVY